ncbi:thiamine phosphate synthase [Pedobacter frigoris]|uniref:Thiamine-phosphate synthase n=1 Tax=Pedobacter frigoris TaxID=2571272 RepID=A0A4U1CIP8_9SPHI|nr:thiamine phosphate synthase [Pedobacter frigoris]TKC05926.1 thiamine phosphate synthase [Pedobacter frigoris]
MIDKLHYISQSPENGSHLDAIDKVLQSGGKWIQLRVKNQPEEVVLDLALRANSLCKSYGAKLIVNDYPEIARAAGAYGVHLGLDDMPIKVARKIVGDHMIIGGTANTFEHILKRVADGANYIGLGPYRFTSTKEKLSPIIGLTGYQVIMKQVRNERLDIPIIAIGGIEAEDMPLLIETGLYGVAVSGALSKDPHITEKLKIMNESLTKKMQHVKDSR